MGQPGEQPGNVHADRGDRDVTSDPDPARTHPLSPEPTSDGNQPTDYVVGTPDASGLMRIGNYSLVRVIDSGGMGTIWEAIQDRPRRVVALKVMRHGLRSRGAMRRFEYEAQALARMRSAAIAQVYEYGTEQHGHAVTPFFSMEFVPGGLPITEYAAKHQLPLEKRLRMFVEICDALQQVHEKGILHRDIKPQNILVDLNGLPKLIDFGIARGVDSDQASATMQTEPNQLLGTLQYMSPEQLEGDSRELDPRADVYALGVVLYELACGTLPYDVTTARLAEASRVIREQPPMRPSSAAPGLQPDLETVILTALHKDRTRRYASARELATDIRHVLADEPIAARRDSATYLIKSRLGAQARRHRIVAIILTTLAAIVIGEAIGQMVEYRAHAFKRYSRFAIERLTRHHNPTFNHVRVVSFRSDAEYFELARKFGIPAGDTVTRGLKRAVRGELFKRLADSGAKGVVLDSYMLKPELDSDSDARLIAGVDALLAKRIPFTAGINTYDLLRGGNPPIIEPMWTRAHWGHILGGTERGDPWSVALNSRRADGSAQIPSLVMAAYVSMRHPEPKGGPSPSSVVPRTSSAPFDKLVLIYDRAGKVVGQVDVTKYQQPGSTKPSGQRPDDYQALLYVAVPPDSVLRASDVSATEVLDMSDETLRDHFGSKAILVCEEQPGLDHHRYIDGRMVFGGQLQAAALDALLSGRAITTPGWVRFIGGSFDTRPVIESLAAVAAALAAIYVARSARPWLLNMVFASAIFAIVVGACLSAYRWNDMLYSPLVPLLTSLLAFELAFFVRRAAGRHIV